MMVIWSGQAQEMVQRGYGCPVVKTDEGEVEFIHNNTTKYVRGVSFPTEQSKRRASERHQAGSTAAR